MDRRSTPPLRHALAPVALLAALLTAATACAQARPSNAEKAEAAAISQVAAGKRQAGEYALCAELYARALTLDPATPLYRYGRARCAQEEGERIDALPAGEVAAQWSRRQLWYQLAQADFAAFLAAAQGGSELADFVAEARRQAARIDRALERSAPDVVAAPAPPVAHAPSVSAAERWREAGLWTLAGGGVALIVGAGLAIGSWSKWTSYQDARSRKADGTVSDPLYSQAFALRNASIAVGSVGALAIAAGAWMRWWQAPSLETAVHLLPAPGGMSLVVHF